MDFEIVGDITAIETIAVGPAIRELAGLCRSYGSGRWRKLEGRAWVRWETGALRWAELHGYEAHGIGTKEFKIKGYPKR